MQIQRPQRGLSIVLLSAATVLLCSLGAVCQEPSKTSSTENPSRSDSDLAKEQLQQKIAGLIEQLGDENFQTRRAAEIALVRIGLPAFEQLRQAMNHPNVQIEVAARYLVRSQSVTWWLDTDPLSVRQVLQDYNELKNEDRETTMHQLANEKTDNALLALCRITRYESSEKLSKAAALFLMETIVDRIDLAESSKLTPHIREAMGDSQRPAAQWVEALVDTIDDGAPNAEQWRNLAKLEYILLEKTPRDTSKALVMRLHRVIAAQFIKHSQRELALDIVRPCLDLVENKTMQVRGAAIWAIDAGLPELVSDLAERHNELFAAEPLLGFLKAESFLAAGDTERAEATAEMASDSIVRTGIEHNLVAKEDIAAIQRFEIAESLRLRGMYKWAQTEYEKSLAAGQPKENSSNNPVQPNPEPALGKQDSNNPGEQAVPSARPSLSIRMEFRVRVSLAELFAEGEDYASAAKTLGEYLEKLEANPVEKDRLEKNNTGNDAQTDYAFLIGNFNFYSGKAAYRDRAISAANAFFMEAFKHYPENPDILIAMQHTCERGVNDEFYKKTLAENIANFHEEIASLERAVINSDRIMRQSREYELAGLCNQLAWLLSNTNERPKEAIKLSLRSLELRPNYGIYQDTLARCYFAAGNIDDAIAMQELAIKNEPFQRSMVRQLEEFKAAKR